MKEQLPNIVNRLVVKKIFKEDDVEAFLAIKDHKVVGGCVYRVHSDKKFFELLYVCVDESSKKQVT